MVLPSGSWEHPLECMNCRAICHCGWGPASHKKSSLSPRRSNSRQQGTNVVCTAWAASAMRPAGLSRFPYGPAFSKAKRNSDGLRGKCWELQIHNPGAFTWTPVQPWAPVNATSPAWVNLTAGRCALWHTGYSGSFCRLIWWGHLISRIPRIKIIAFAVFDHVSLKDEMNNSSLVSWSH